MSQATTSRHQKARGDAAIDTGRDSLIATLLTSQRELTAVEIFSERADSIGTGRYESLLPATPPGPGQQYAFEVDLDRCSGCKACVSACHSLNGLGEGESWRDVGLIVGAGPSLPILQHVTSSCHHCLDPACLSACPVDAYEKDPVTGIVRHLDDQCFGCQYCTLACPYDAPKYQPSQGIVRKCDMCSDRLSEGEAPACAQACPHEAIRIRIVEVGDVARRAADGEFLPSAFDPSYTRPTTLYRTDRPFGLGLLGSDHHQVKPEHAHSPLIVMLVLTQLSAGAFLIDLAMTMAGGWVDSEARRLHLAIGFAIGQIGLVASLAHLGRPQFAYRALIGLRHSWLSREVAAFGGFAALSSALTLLIVAGFPAGIGPTLRGGLGVATAVSGMAGVFASVMVYHAVRRPFWHASRVGPAFAGTALVLGLATALAARLASKSGGTAEAIALTLAGATLVKLLFEASLLVHLGDRELSPLRRSALLMVGPLARPALGRMLLGIAGGLVLPLAIAFGSPARPGLVAGFALMLLILGELAERYLFFSAVTRPKMPGS